MRNNGKLLAYQFNNMLISMDGLAVLAERIPDESLTEIIKLAEDLGLDVFKKDSGDITVKGEKDKLYTLLVKINHRVLEATIIA